MLQELFILQDNSCTTKHPNNFSPEHFKRKREKGVKREETQHMLGHTKRSSRAISLQQACTVVPQNYVKFCFESAIQPPSLVSVLLPDHSTGWMLVHGDAHPPALPPDGASGTAATKDHHVFSRVAESLLLSHSPTAIRNCGPSNTYHDREPKNY